MGIVASTADLFPDQLERLREAGHEVHLVKEAGCESLDSVIVSADALICQLTNPVGSELLDIAPHMRIVANVAVGYENIDVAAAETRGVVVTNTPDVLTESTADHTFALLLAVARRITEADVSVRQGEFPSWGLHQPLTGIDVHGKTLGIVGMGRIGAAVARRGHCGFSMPVLYHSRTPKPELERELSAVRVPFGDLLERSDFVSIHVPLSPETRHMFGADSFEQMKPTAVLVNVARGAVVDETALVAALKKGAIAGAGLDVFEQEPAVHPELLKLHRHVVLAPHLGSATEETRKAMADIAVDNVLAVLAGQAPITPVK
ncbi:2-hydroxyacid dehydrogenase [Candidatus Bipolaricaulota bacterium]